jgi:hypothetical protein
MNTMHLVKPTILGIIILFNANNNNLMNPFTIGDTVRMKSGGPEMTVIRVIGDSKEDQFVFIDSRGYEAGDVIYDWGKKLIRNGKYYAAIEIWNAEGEKLLDIDKKKTKIKPGDIAAIEGHHVEIVTRVDGNSFCSIGVGRGSSYPFWSGNGIEICGWEPVAKNRYIDNKVIRFRRMK